MKQTVKIFKSLSDPTRLRILFLLLQHELCVCDLTYILEMEQSRISHQLRVLRNADLLEDVRDGKWIIYRISEKKKKELKLIFDRIIGKDLANYEEMTKDKAKLQDSQKNSLRNCSASFERRDI